MIPLYFSIIRNPSTLQKYHKLYFRYIILLKCGCIISIEGRWREWCWSWWEERSCYRCSQRHQSCRRTGHCGTCFHYLWHFMYALLCSIKSCWYEMLKSKKCVSTDFPLFISIYALYHISVINLIIISPLTISLSLHSTARRRSCSTMGFQTTCCCEGKVWEYGSKDRRRDYRESVQSSSESYC